MSYFKYVSEDVAMKVLQCQRIRITQASQLNDPFEILPEFRFEKPQSQIKRKKFLEDLQTLIPDTSDYCSAHRTIYRALNNELKFLSEEINFAHIIKTLQNCIGILSMTNRKDNILMWSHYSNNHKDVVFEFDEDNDFFKQDYFGKPQKVIYKNKRQTKSSLNLQIKDLFFYKSNVWKYENEIRMLVPVQNAYNFTSRYLNCDYDGKDYNIYLLDIPNDLIKAIYFGANTNFAHPTKPKIQIRDLLHEKYPKVKIYQGVVEKHDYSIRFDDVTKFTNSWGLL